MPTYVCALFEKFLLMFVPFTKRSYLFLCPFENPSPYLCPLRENCLPICRPFSPQAQGRLRLTLVDHNAVSGPLSGLGDAVVAIVDHHQDLTEHAHVQGNARCGVRPAGYVGVRFLFSAFETFLFFNLTYHNGTYNYFPLRKEKNSTFS